jgi:hypothetical protein
MLYMENHEKINFENIFLLQTGSEFDIILSVEMMNCYQAAKRLRGSVVL